MYLEYWQLGARPFDNHGGPEYYYPSEGHQATRLKLRYGIENRCGGLLLAGAAGLGKTMLVEHLQHDVPETYQPVVHVKFPQMAPRELVALLAHELSGQNPTGSVEENIRRIARALTENAAKDQHAILVIDEAHLLRDTDTLEAVRLLLNYERQATVLLVGQPSLLPALERAPALEERLTVKCLLRPFALDETVSYVQHRLLVAGAADVHRIFAAEALETVHQVSGGIPRRINRLCDLALLIGFAEECPVINSTLVAAVANEIATASPSVRQAA